MMKWQPSQRIRSRRFAASSTICRTVPTCARYSLGLGRRLCSRCLGTWFARASANDVHDALLFSEYAIRFGLAARDFADAYVRSELPAVIRRQIYAPDYTVRHLAVHAVSRLGPRENSRHLAAAVPWYLTHDPLNLSGLLVELRLLDNNVAWRAQLEAMVAAPLYLTRWAAVEVLWEHGAGPIIRQGRATPRGHANSFERWLGIVIRLYAGRHSGTSMNFE